MLNTLRLPDETYSESDEETLTLLTVMHFPGFKGPTEPYEIAYPARVRWALKSFNPFQSPGPDSIDPVLIQRVGDPFI